MAIDTRDKRASVIGVAHYGAPQVFPNPSGTVGASARYQIAYAYNGFATPAGATRPWGVLIARAPAPPPD
jgi:hypothetical protein